MTSNIYFPDSAWKTRSPEELGFEPHKLAAVQGTLQKDAGAGDRYRVVVVRSGTIAAEWNQGVDPSARLSIASANKSLIACLLGIAIDEGKITSADARISEYYPEILDVPEGTGPKPGRSNKPEDVDITFRHCITNTSGYLKPGELPGQVFHYQSWGMSVIMHALGKLYGVYDAKEPEGSVGPAELIREKIRDRIGGSWSWEFFNFEHPPEARSGIFGYHTRLMMTCRDMARCGWLWRCQGSWRGQQVVPADWMREITVTAPQIRQNCPEGDWRYGHAFWTNDCGKQWPSLPRDSYAAAGAGSQHIWVCPSLDLVVAQSPGTYDMDQQKNETGVLRGIVDALIA